MKDKIFKKLIADVESVLDDYGWGYNHETIQLIAQQWATNKTELRKLFSKHPYWIEEKQYIVFENDYERKRDEEAIQNFRDWFVAKICENSCNIIDYFPKIAEYAGWDTYKGCFVKNVFDALIYAEENTCSEEQEYILTKYVPELRCKKGQKISRIVNKICKKLKIDDSGSDYNSEFAKFADALNPIKYKRFTIISLNMIDYLLSSNGNSWSSCHTIDIHQKYQSEYRGESCSGTMSYMLDKTTFVMYTVDAKYNGKDFELQPKINRQMYQYSDYKLLQGRLYPQNNDGQIGDNLRTDFRNIMQKVIADCLEKPNMWVMKTSTDYRVYNKICTMPHATHYPDYVYDRNKCTLSLLKVDTEEEKFIEEKRMYVGFDIRCIMCGKVHDNHNTLYCSECDNKYNDIDEPEDW